MTRLFAVLAVAVMAVAVAAPVKPDKKEDFGPVTDEQLKEAANRMKQIGIALHAHNDTWNFLPHDTQVDGKPGLSWRVAILPFIEQENLYKQFRLDEAWDSEHNKTLVEKMPDFYAPIRVKTKEKGRTFYQGFDGADTTFEAGKKLRIPASFPDGTSNTVAVVEAGEPVVWTQPGDIKYDPAKGLPKLGGLFDGDFHAVLMDGSVQRAFAAKMNVPNFKLMVTRSDGMVIGRNAFGDE